MHRVAALLLSLALVGCGPGGTDADPPAASAAGGQRLLTCAGDDLPFSAGALAAAPGAESGVGPQFEALRDGLAFSVDEPGYLPATGWRLVARDAGRILFLAPVPGSAPPEWRHVAVELLDGAWRWSGGGDCNLRVVLGAGIGPADWALDPSFPVPGPAETTVHVLVWEMACASGEAATGRVVGPTVELDADAVTFTFGVRPRPGQVQTCPSNPPTPVVVELAEPLGARVLLDGGTFPARPPEPPF